jgi:hypothetical protein
MSKKNLTLAVPVILAASVVAIALSATSGRAADECLRGPNATAPSGSHWYYRVDRPTGRHCWYLGAQGQKVRSVSERTSQQTRKRVAQQSQTAQPVAQQPAVRPAAPPTQPPADAKPAASFFSQYWASLFTAAEPPRIPPPAETAPLATTAEATRPAGPNDTSRLAAPVDASRPATASVTSNFAQEANQADAQDEMPPVWPVLTAAEANAASVPAAAPAAIKSQHMLAILVGALALAGILMALVYRLASIRLGRRQRPHQRVRWDIAAATPSLPMPALGSARALPRPASMPVVRKPVPAKHPPELDRELRMPVPAKRAPEPDREQRKPVLGKRPPVLDREPREPHEARRLRELLELRQGLELRLEELRDARRRSAA